MLSDADRTMLWRAGRLKFLLHDSQQRVYDQFHTWRNNLIAQRKRGERPKGKFPRIFCADAGRRFGKDWFGLAIMLERALRKPNATLTYASAKRRDIEDVVNSADLLKKMIDGAPVDCTPVYKTNYRGQAEGLYLPNGSVIKLVGIDLHPDALRGRGSDGICISEAAFCGDLDRTVETVLLPQFLGREDAFLMMNSTPDDTGTAAWDSEFVPDAKDRGAYILQTLWDAPQYSDQEKYEYLKIDGDEVDRICTERQYTPEQKKKFLDEGCEGMVGPRQQREYLCIRTRESDTVVVPEFDEKKHVREFELPKYYHAYTVIDPAVKDLAAINFIAWDFVNARMLVLDEWTRRNANTNEIVDAIRTKEKELWTNSMFWDGSALKPNPYLRVSDTDLRMITDMRQLHDMAITPAKKDDAESALHALRDAFQANKIWIHPRCVNTREHVAAAKWNKARTSYERSERLGHADHLDVLKYAVRSIARSKNPNPPAGWVAAQATRPDKLFLTKHHMKHPSSLVDKLNSILPQTWVRKR